MVSGSSGRGLRSSITEPRESGGPGAPAFHNAPLPPGAKVGAAQGQQTKPGRPHLTFVDQFKALGFPAPLPLGELHGAGRKERGGHRTELRPSDQQYTRGLGETAAPAANKGIRDKLAPVSPPLPPRTLRESGVRRGEPRGGDAAAFPPAGCAAAARRRRAARNGFAAGAGTPVPPAGGRKAAVPPAGSRRHRGAGPPPLGPAVG